jgi:hypothetical protein
LSLFLWRRGVRLARARSLPSFAPQHTNIHTTTTTTAQNTHTRKKRKDGGVLPYDKALYAAPADTNADYPGSCGRCYEIQCKPGLVYDYGKPVSIKSFYYLAGVDATPKDDYGRSYPGECLCEGRGGEGRLARARANNAAKQTHAHNHRPSNLKTPSSTTTHTQKRQPGRG